MHNKRLFKDLWVAYFAVMLTWGVLAYFELAQLNARHALFAFTRAGHPYISDFVNIYNAALLSQACAGSSINIYDPKLQADFANKITSPVIAEQPFYLQYPPYFFVLVQPLANLSLTHAYLIWCLLGLLFLLVSIEKLSVSYQTAFSKAFVIMAVLSSFPTWLSFKLGQTSLWLLPGLVIFFNFLRRRRFFLAGIATSISMVKLQYLPIVILVGIVLGRNACFLGILSAAVVLCLISLFSLGWSNIISFPYALYYGETGQAVSGVSSEVMQNLRGQLVLLWGQDSFFIHLITLLVLALTICGSAWLWWKFQDNALLDEHNFKVCASVSTLLLLITSPHTHVQDYLIAAIPCLWLWSAVSREKLQSSKLTIKILILSFPALSWIFFFFREQFQMLYIQPYFFWALILAIVALRELRLSDKLR